MGDVKRGDTRIYPPATPVDGEAEANDGWGFADTRFVVQPNQAVILTGKRYTLCGDELPTLMPWFSKMLDAPLSYENRHPAQYPPPIPKAMDAPGLLTELRQTLSAEQMTDDAPVRLRHGHGHTGGEIWAIRYNKLPRVPDLVVYPTSHDQVVALVRIAKKHDAMLLPFGGGTNVTEALTLAPDEKRYVIAVDMRRMHRLLWIDPVNHTACIEAGATGRHITDELGRHGFTMGHEPDSLEFSTLGGWVATNASGMKKNRYGNIEDIVLDVQMVTSLGVIERPNVGPRESVGANPKNLAFGSEGNLGIITSAVVKIFKKPEAQVYGSVLFPTLDAGLAFLYDLQAAGVVPASVRVMDSVQFQFGQALKPEHHGIFAKTKSAIEKFVVLKLRGYEVDKLAVATIVFEGTAAEVAYQEKLLYPIAAKHGGMKAGATNGERGYQLTFGIAYIRDLTFEHWAIAESFETSVPWSRAMELYERVRDRVQKEHAARKLPGKPFFTGRITQVYQAGVAMYFYMGFYAKGVDDPVRVYTEIEHAAREEILASGGSLSHHHGIGKIREDFLPEIYSEGALTVTRQVKKALDPSNVFGAGNHGAIARPSKIADTKQQVG